MNYLKARDQSIHVTLVIANTVFKAISKILTKMDLWYQTDLLGSFVHVCLVS